MRAYIELGVRVCGGGERTTHGLQDQGGEITADEDVGVCEGLEAGEVLPVDDHDASEAEIYGGAEEGWTEGYTD